MPSTPVQQGCFKQNLKELEKHPDASEKLGKQIRLQQVILQNLLGCLEVRVLA